MFKRETIEKYVATMSNVIAEYRKAEEIKLSFSYGNRKIGSVLNVSTAPLFTCRNCAECRFHCYDMKACLQYGNVLRARGKNTALLIKDRDEFFRQVSEKMSRRRKNLYMRYSVGGGAPDADYLERQSKTAAEHPEYIAVWTYTKNYTAAAEYIENIGGRENMPKNYKVMLSEWRGVPMYNPYGLPVFACRMPGENVPSGCTWECPGNCDVCKEQHRGCIAGESTWTWLH